MRWLLGLLALAFLWEAGWSLFGPGRIGPRNLADRLASGQTPLLVDVRTPVEYRWFHIPGAHNAPFGSAELDTLLERRSAEGGTRPVVLICMTGHRSPLEAWRWQRKGVADVRDLAGGMVGWKLAGGASVGGPDPGRVSD